MPRSRGTIAHFSPAKLRKVIKDTVVAGIGVYVTDGSTVNVDYDGADSIILGATDGTGITVDVSNDKMMIYDTDTATTKYITPNQIDSAAAGSNMNLQYNSGSTKAGAAQLNYDASTGYLGVGTGSASYRIDIPNSSNAGGQVRANAFITYSTRRLKKDIKPLENSLNIVANLQGVEFRWKDSDRLDYGFIAEDVGKTLPGVVQWDENGKDALSMDYTRIISFLVEAVKEQQEQISELKHLVKNNCSSCCKKK
tara:strand:- start:57 stop:815 length:759 start_codon:yes stop_codon:yes gene_type:complete